MEHRQQGVLFGEPLFTAALKRAIATMDAKDTYTTISQAPGIPITCRCQDNRNSPMVQSLWATRVLELELSGDGHVLEALNMPPEVLVQRTAWAEQWRQFWEDMIATHAADMIATQRYDRRAANHDDDILGYVKQMPDMEMHSLGDEAPVQQTKMHKHDHVRHGQRNASMPRDSKPT